MLAPLLFALLLTAAAVDNLVTEPLPDGRFRISVTYPAGSPPEVQVRMMMRLREAAARACRGRPAPVDDGTIQLDSVPGRRDRVTMIQTFSCGPRAV